MPHLILLPNTPAVIGFTSFLLGVVNGEVKIADWSSRNVEFFFCSHKWRVLFPFNRGILPFEVTWANKTKKKLYSNDYRHTGFSLDKVRITTWHDRPDYSVVDDDKVESVKAVLALIREADIQHRVNWQVGNVFELVRTFEPQRAILYQGRKTTSQELVHHNE